MNFSLRLRITLAVFSGLACALTWMLPKISGWEAESWLDFYGLPALFFGAGVLFPYVGPGKVRYVRYFGLVLASVVSYWCAIWLAAAGPGSRTCRDFAHGGQHSGCGNCYAGSRIDYTDTRFVRVCATRRACGRRRRPFSILRRFS